MGTQPYNSLFEETFAMEHLLQRGGGKRRPEVVFDVDGVPVDTHGKQQGSKWNGYYKRTIFLPLFAICGESGDMLGVELRGGTQNVVKDCYGFIRRIGLALREHVADKVIVRLDAGFNSGELCDKLENDRIGYVMRLKGNDVINGLALPCTNKSSIAVRFWVSSGQLSLAWLSEYLGYFGLTGMVCDLR